MVKEITSLSQFKEETQFSGLSIVDFHATWCGPCKMIAPLLDQLEGQFKDAHFFKVDVDQVPDVSSEMGITHMPTILFFKNGEKVETVVGANVQKIRSTIQQFAA